MLAILKARETAATDFRRRALLSSSSRARKNADVPAETKTSPSIKPADAHETKTTETQKDASETKSALTKETVALALIKSAEVEGKSVLPELVLSSPKPLPGEAKTLPSTKPPRVQTTKAPPVPQVPLKISPKTPSIQVHQLTCPHCGIKIEVASNEINCTIFRCGIMKDTFQQINPHLPKAACDALVAENKIYGCGKPFKFDGTRTTICGYI